MPDLYALDSNVYIDALRSRADLEPLTAFLLRAGGRVVVSAVVAMELRAGAFTNDDEADVHALLGAYRQRGRMIVPTFEAYVQAGRVLAALRFPSRSRGRIPASSFVADVLLAASCREAGVVLVTKNTADFSRIQRHLRGFRFTAPWPPAGSHRG